MVVKDVKDVCFHSYFSVMDDLRQKGPPTGKYYEIRSCHCMPHVFVFSPLKHSLEFVVVLSTSKFLFLVNNRVAVFCFCSGLLDEYGPLNLVVVCVHKGVFH